MKRVTYMAMAVLVGVLISNVVPAQSATEIKTIKGCVNKKTTELRISSKCKTGETPLTWNVSGVKGEKGEKGDSGASGSSGSSSGKMVVVDANGALVGYPMGRSIFSEAGPNVGLNTDLSSLDIFMPSINKVVSLSTSGLPVGGALYYSTTDCSGVPFMDVSAATSPKPLYAHNQGVTTYWYQYTTSLGTNTVTTHSNKVSGSPTCNVATSGVGGGGGGGDVFTLTPTSAPYTNPVGPLRIVIQ